ncbi:hypothetical protein CLAIMM_13486 [Cladophialophora immunda]|nr:hypothetical protein CLAIMM_13486 [Cladophialophora immunda]
MVRTQPTRTFVHHVAQTIKLCLETRDGNLPDIAEHLDTLAHQLVANTEWIDTESAHKIRSGLTLDLKPLQQWHKPEELLEARKARQLKRDAKRAVGFGGKSPRLVLEFKGWEIEPAEGVLRWVLVNDAKRQYVQVFDPNNQAEISSKLTKGQLYDEHGQQWQDRYDKVLIKPNPRGVNFGRFLWVMKQGEGFNEEDFQAQAKAHRFFNADGERYSSDDADKKLVELDGYSHRYVLIQQDADEAMKQ